MSIAGSAIVAGATLLGTAGSAMSQGKMNKATRRYNERMWEKQNAYNHPTMQMARLKEAGLNPHLVYGNSASGSAGNADSIAKGENVQLPDMGNSFATATQNYITNRRVEQEIAASKTKQAVDEAQILNMNANTANTVLRTSSDALQLDIAQQLKTNTIEAALQQTSNLKGTGNQIQATVDNMIQSTLESKARTLNINVNTDKGRQEIKQIKQNIEESIGRIKMMKLDGEHKKADTERIRLENNLRRVGLNPNDPAWQRIIVQGTGITAEGLKSGAERIGNTIGGYFNKLKRNWQGK